MANNKLRPLQADELRAFLTAGVSAMAVAISAPAFAQDDVVTIPDADDSADSADADDRIVVTGSRIRRDEFSSSSPIQVIDPEIGELQGQFDTASLVQSSSIAAGSAQVTAAISSNFIANGGVGAATVSLRGLGADRTLVLLNGRRAGPAGTRGAVNAFDLNVIPQSVIGTVEIQKDGASSIYGSDAVAGVVNLITKRNQEGLELDGFFSQPFDGGGEIARGSLTWGKTFDRGHITVALDYYKQWELQRRDREWLDCAEDYIFDPNTGARADTVDPRPSGLNYTGPNNYACNGTTWGHIWLYDYSYYYSPNGSNVNGALTDEFGNPSTGTILFQYDYDGSLAGLGIPQIPAPLDPGQVGLPPGWFPVAYDRVTNGITNSYSEAERNDYVIPRVERFTVFADAAYELTDNVEGYVEFLGNRRETTTDAVSQFWNFTLTSDFPLFGLTPDPIVNPQITGPALISPTTLTTRSQRQDIQVDYIRAMGGFRGDFSNGWEWDIYAQHSRSDGDYSNARLLQDAVDLNDFGQRASGFGCAGLTTPISNRPCIDIDFNDPQFLADNLTADQIAFLFDSETGNTVYTQTYVEAFLTGDLFDLPAGTVGAAVGGTWRRDFIEDTPGPITLAGNAWGASSAGITTGSSKTKEVFGEVVIPIFRDAPMAQYMEVTGSVRYTDVSTVGDDITWKAGLNWQVVDWMKLRGTWGTSFRAPALFELFLADQTSFLSQRSVDPCINWGAALASGGISQRVADNCAAQGVPNNHSGAGVSATIVTGGGLGVLEPETSTAKTAGIVLSADALLPDNASLDLGVDYFNIEVNGEIATLSAGNIVFGCLDSDFFPTDPLCSLFTRGQTGAPSNINTVRASFLNINSQKNTGLDITARYQHEQLLFGWDVDILAQFTRQFKDDVALFAGTVVSNNGEDGEPKWVGDANMLFRRNDWTLFWGVDFVGPTSDEQDYLDANGTLCPTSVELGQYCVDVTAPMRLYHNVSVTKELENIDLTVGVANLFDLDPPRVSTLNGAEISTIGQAPFASNYDFLGRRIFLNATARF